MNAERPMPVLLVEDNADHAALTMRALRNGNMLNDVVWARDGEEALDALHGRGRFETPIRPVVILLDIKLPRVDGLEVLRRIKDDEALKTVPVVMLTTSGQAQDVNRAYAAGANGFVTKPVSFKEFVERVQTLKLYWVLTNVPGDA